MLKERTLHVPCFEDHKLPESNALQGGEFKEAVAEWLVCWAWTLAGIYLNPACDRAFKDYSHACLDTPTSSLFAKDSVERCKSVPTDILRKNNCCY